MASDPSRRRRPAHRAAWLAVALLLAHGPAGAAAPPPAAPLSAGVRTADHPGYGRLVLDLPAGATARVARDGDRIAVVLDPPCPVAQPARLPRNVLAFDAAPGRAAIAIAPGSDWRTARLGQRVVIDVLDRTAAPTASRPLAQAPPRAALRATRRAAAAPHVADTDKFAAPDAPVPTATPSALPAPPPATPVRPPLAVADRDKFRPETLVPAPGPLSLQARLLPPDPAGDVVAPGLALPFDAQTAAAAFRRGAGAVVVFDEPRPIDTAILRADPSFAALTVAVMPGATVLRFPLPADRGLALARVPGGWTVRVTQAASPAAPLVPRLADDTLTLAPAHAATTATPADRPAPPGRVVTVADPDTGALLLVGTARTAGQGVAAPSRTPRFLLLPSWQGVAIEPLADTLALRPAQDGFALTATDGLALAGGDRAAALAEAAALTRSFDIPSLPSEALLRRMQSRVADAATAPVLARFAPRVQAAEAMLGLGLGPEAQAALALARRDDPRRADDPALIGLQAVAALVAGRPDEAGGIEDPRLAGTDEIGFWRAVRLAQMQEQGPEGAQAPPAAAAALAATAPLLLAYPAPLRARLLPLVAETLAGGGEIAAATALLAGQPADPRLALARALLAEARGDTPAALAAYDALDTLPDRLIRLRAMTRAAELRRAAGALDAAGAAAALERALIVWRGDARELALRLHIAGLRAEAGA